MTYIITIDKTIHHEGDERSRTHPGHGYPAWVEVIPTHTIYNDYELFLTAIEALTKIKKPFKAYSASELEIKVETTIKIGGV